MRKITLLVAAMFVAASGMAQKTVVASGGSATGMSGARISYSVGQVAIGTAQSTHFKVFEGVQQPLQISEMTVDEALRLAVEMKVYPNPTADAVCLYRVDDVDSRLTYSLISAQGAEMLTGVLEDVSTTISLRSMPAGTYVLRVGNGKQHKAYRIVKK